MKIIELIEITINGVVFKYKTGEETNTAFFDYTLSTVEIQDGVVSTTETLSKALKISFPVKDNVSIYYLNNTIVSDVSIVIKKADRDEETAIVVYSGIITKASVESKKLTFHSDSVFSRLKNNALHNILGLRCRYTLYDDNCTLDKETKKIECDISYEEADLPRQLNKVQIFYTPQITWPMKGGYLLIDGVDYFILEWEDLGDDKYEATINRDITFNITQTPYTKAIVAYAGCDYSFDNCTQLSNQLNFGGARYIPTRNPFVSLENLYIGEENL